MRNFFLIFCFLGTVWTAYFFAGVEEEDKPDKVKRELTKHIHKILKDYEIGKIKSDEVTIEEARDFVKEYEERQKSIRLLYEKGKRD